MKANTYPALGSNLCRLCGLIAICILVLALNSGCANAGKRLEQFQDLGITEATITGKFSNTDYKVTEEDGTRRAELDHTNVWFPKIRLVREAPIED